MSFKQLDAPKLATPSKDCFGFSNLLKPKCVQKESLGDAASFPFSFMVVEITLCDTKVGRNLHAFSKLKSIACTGSEGGKNGLLGVGFLLGCPLQPVYTELWDPISHHAWSKQPTASLFFSFANPENVPYQKKEMAQQAVPGVSMTP